MNISGDSGICKKTFTIFITALLMFILGTYYDNGLDLGYELISSVVKSRNGTDVISTVIEYQSYKHYKNYTDVILNVAPETYIPEPYSSNISDHCIQGLIAKSCYKSEISLSSINSLNSTIRIKFDGSFECALLVFNTVLDSIRKSNLANIEYQNISLQKPDAVAADSYMNGKPALYFSTIARFPHVTTIALEWESYQAKQWNVCKLPVESFFFAYKFPPTDVCTLENVTKQCEENLDMNFVYNGTPDGLWEHQKLVEHPVHQQYLSHIHVIHNGYVDANSAVTSGGLDIIPFQCSVNYAVHSRPRNEPMYDELFSISMYWGMGYFHASIEDMPRLGPFVDFLLANPHIKIHVASKIIKNSLQILGFDESRIVMGRVHAKLVYLPAGGGCGWIRPLPCLALTKRYQEYITSSLNASSLAKDVIILIRRKRNRWLAQHNEIEEYLQTTAQQHDMSYWIFDDRHLPSFNETLEMFYRARLIVAPHGAGLSNIVFTAPGATVIEVLCNPKPNGCYCNTIKTLGHAYIGLLAKRGNCGPMHIDLNYFKQVTEMVLSRIKANKQTSSASS